MHHTEVCSLVTVPNICYSNKEDKLLDLTICGLLFLYIRLRPASDNLKIKTLKNQRAFQFCTDKLALPFLMAQLISI